MLGTLDVALEQDAVDRTLVLIGAGQVFSGTRW
jgi:hypothetical protein